MSPPVVPSAWVAWVAHLARVDGVDGAEVGTAIAGLGRFRVPAPPWTADVAATLAERGRHLHGPGGPATLSSDDDRQWRWRRVAARLLELPAAADGTDAVRLALPVNWAAVGALEWQAARRLAHTDPELVRRLRRARPWPRGALSADLRLDVRSLGYAYGLAQSARHAVAETLPVLMDELARLADLLVVAPEWRRTTLGEVLRLQSHGWVQRVRVAQPRGYRSFAGPAAGVMREGALALRDLAAAGALEQVRDLGYALHNVPASIWGDPPLRGLRRIAQRGAGFPGLLAAVDRARAAGP